MVVVTTSIIAAGAAELVGPVPTELQFYNSFAGGVGTDAKQADIAKGIYQLYHGPSCGGLVQGQWNGTWGSATMTWGLMSALRPVDVRCIPKADVLGTCVATDKIGFVL
jgi:hypothetical protein